MSKLNRVPTDYVYFDKQGREFGVFQSTHTGKYELWRKATLDELISARGLGYKWRELWYSVRNDTAANLLSYEFGLDMAY